LFIEQNRPLKRHKWHHCCNGMSEATSVHPSHFFANHIIDYGSCHLCREGRRFHSEDVADGERVAARAWRLLRAGRPGEAASLAESTGQPWQAALIGPPGVPLGPLPLGPAAAAADADTATAGEEALAVEVDLAGAGAGLRSLCRWAWYQVGC
jgi:hypothetical protein